MYKKALLALTMSLMVGCTTRLVDFTVISSKNVDLSRGAEFKRHNSRVTGEDLARVIIFIPTGTPNAKEALDRAIESVPGAVALLDGVLTYEWFYIPYIYGESKYIIEGTPLIDPRLRSASSPIEEKGYQFVYLNKDGEIAKVLKVSKEVFELQANKSKS